MPAFPPPPSNRPLPFEITWSTLWRIALFALAVFLAFEGRNVLIALFLALVISSGLDFFVNFFERRGVPRTVSVIALFLVAAFIVVVITYVLAPIVIADLHDVIGYFDPQAASYWLGPLLNFNGSRSITVLFNRLSGQFINGSGVSLDTFSNAFDRVALGVTVVVSSFYLSLSRDGVERFIRAVLPDKYENITLTIYRRSRRKIGVWLRTQLLLSLLLGFVTWLALTLLGVQHPLVIAVLAAFLELVPFVGPLIAGAAATLVALLTSPTLAVATLIVFIIIHQLETHVLVPLLTGRSVGLHPVIVIIALFIGLQAAGVLGAIIAVPAVAVIQEMLEEFASRKRNPDVPLPMPGA